MLGTARHIGALVLEIERTRAQLAKAGLVSGVRQQRDGAAPLIGSTAVMRVLRSRIERVAATDFTVLVEGESGVGKELVARQIHDLSRRKERALSWQSIVRRSSKRCSRRNSLGSKIALRLGFAGDEASSNMLMAARCFWTKCPTCQRPLRPSFCGPFRILRWNGSAEMAPIGSISESSLRQTGASAKWWSNGCSGRIFTTG